MRAQARAAFNGLHRCEEAEQVSKGTSVLRRLGAFLHSTDKVSSSGLEDLGSQGPVLGFRGSFFLSVSLPMPPTALASRAAHVGVW